MKKQILKLSVISCLLLGVHAQAETAEKELPKSGSLSTSSAGTSASRAVPDAWGGVDPQGKESAPITGSVSKQTPTKWIARVFNNTDETYTVNLVVNQFNRSNTKIKSDSFSYTLRGKQSAERDITALSTTEQCTLDLVNWTKKASAPPAKP